MSAPVTVVVAEDSSGQKVHNLILSLVNGLEELSLRLDTKLKPICVSDTIAKGIAINSNPPEHMPEYFAALRDNGVKCMSLISTMHSILDRCDL